MSSSSFAATALTVAFLATGLTACGGGSGSSPSSNANAAGQQQRRGPGFFNVSAKVRACLKKQGVTLPTGGRRFNRPPNGQPPAGTNAQPPSGGAPQGAGRGNSAQFQKLRQALAKCGAQLPQGGAPNGNGGPPPTGTTTSANPS